MIYAIILTIEVDRSEYEPHLPDHLEYLAELKRQGTLVLSGPFTDRRGGMVLVKAGSLDEARAIAENDPLVARGLDSYVLREWRITNGVIENLIIE